MAEKKSNRKNPDTRKAPRRAAAARESGQSAETAPPVPAPSKGSKVKTRKQQVRLLSKQLKRVAARAADEAALEEKRKRIERSGKIVKKAGKTVGKGKAGKTGTTGTTGERAPESRASIIANNLAYLQCL